LEAESIELIQCPDIGTLPGVGAAVLEHRQVDAPTRVLRGIRSGEPVRREGRRRPLIQVKHGMNRRLRRSRRDGRAYGRQGNHQPKAVEGGEQKALSHSRGSFRQFQGNNASAGEARQAAKDAMAEENTLCCGMLRIAAAGVGRYNLPTRFKEANPVAEGPSNGDDAPVSVSGPGQRLDSWKEIAGYLNRHVTTVQRWERQEGLPVHRLVHDKLGSVYAYTSELDDWWRNRAERIEHAEREVQPPSVGPDPGDVPDVDVALAGSATVQRPPRSRLRSAGLALAAFVLAATVVGLLIARGGGRDRLDVPFARIQAVAILPLANLSREPDQEYFVDGTTEALITELAKIRSLTVISRTSVMRYKENTKPLREIARELNVDGVVQGAVVRSGGRVRITAQFVDARSDRHLWAETYERDLSDVLALQGEIARAIAGAVQVTLTPQEQRHVARTRPVNLEAYDAYLMGRYLWNKRTADDFQKAVGYFQTANRKRFKVCRRVRRSGRLLFGGRT
jgi:TolB-like protein